MPRVAFGRARVEPARRDQPDQCTPGGRGAVGPACEPSTVRFFPALYILRTRDVVPGFAGAATHLDGFVVEGCDPDPVGTGAREVNSGRVIDARDAHTIHAFGCSLARPGLHAAGGSHPVSALASALGVVG